MTQAMTKEQLIEWYEGLGKPVPKMVTESEAGQRFIFGFSPRHMASLTLHKEGDSFKLFSGISGGPLTEDEL